MLHIHFKHSPRTNTFKFLDLLSRPQHGFMKHRSCSTNLLQTLEEWTCALDEGYPLDVLYLDYQKPFDNVPHHRLNQKLRLYGIDNSLINWIYNFISNRDMRVIVGESIRIGVR